MERKRKLAEQQRLEREKRQQMLGHDSEDSDEREERVCTCISEYVFVYVFGVFLWSCMRRDTVNVDEREKWVCILFSCAYVYFVGFGHKTKNSDEREERACVAYLCVVHVQMCIHACISEKTRILISAQPSIIHTHEYYRRT